MAACFEKEGKKPFDFAKNLRTFYIFFAIGFFWGRGHWGGAFRLLGKGALGVSVFFFPLRLRV